MILAVLSIFSILTVYSSTGTIAYKLSGGNTTGYLMKHVVILGFGLFLAYLAYLTPYMRFMRMAPWLWLIAFGLLVFTLAFGKDINHARRWIEIPFINLTFQTSDFGKLALILLVSREITRHKDYIKDFNKAFMPIILPIIIICGLIAPADLSTALVLFVTCFAMMFIGRVDFKFMFLLVLLAIVGFAVLLAIYQVAPDLVRVDTWVSRITEWWNNPDGGFQNQQAKIAIANGEIFGMGPGNSIQRNYLPTPYADFIFAVFCEEYGLVGSFLLLGLYVMLFFRVTRLVTISEKSFGAMVAVGLSLNIVIQALANMAISVHLVPVGGLTLPMVSWGGTSVLFTCLFFGIILSVSRYIEQAAAQTALAGATEAPTAPTGGGGQQQAQPASQQGGGGGQQGGGQQQRRDGGNYQGGGQNRGGGNQGGGGQGGQNRGGGNYQGGGGQNRGGNQGGGGGHQGGQNRGGGGGNQGGGGQRK
jgi:cell division protein FtsW